MSSSTRCELYFHPTLVGAVISFAICTLASLSPKLLAYDRGIGPHAFIEVLPGISTAKDKMRKKAEAKRRKRTKTRSSDNNCTGAHSNTLDQQSTGANVNSGKASSGRGVAQPGKETGRTPSGTPVTPRSRDEQLEQVNQLEPVPKGKEWKGADAPRTPPSEVNKKEVSSPKTSTTTPGRKPAPRKPPRREQ